ncbi:MAG: beta-ketoacyl synthase N-terminal-like domain-containing protein [Chthoniobacter sp.]|uniref:beta-ketoacyl synthase N-terminal-like domain-containing protein n=1 Tax=Chthoniobacter sp. TaxID=2510640 RepID=UPI0032A583AA
MSARIAGLGWVTPLGAGLDEVWERLGRGDVAEAKMVTNPETGREHVYAPVPPKTVEALGRNPRLRRSSAISYFAVAAGMAALENAGVVITPESAARTALVFAISSGGVIYTRKFYEQIVKQGANTASPMLFPETVYNAPASHLAAQFGIDGASYTLVGDSTVGLAALKFAEQLLATGDLDRVVVVGSEECDWILCEAYRDWRLSRGPGKAHGALLAEGAAAVVLAREGAVELQLHDGVPVFRQQEAEAALTRVYAELLPRGGADAVIGCANGTFVDAIERRVIGRHLPEAAVYFPRQSLGEALGASALLQTVVAALAVRHGALPGAADAKRIETTFVSALGFNQQASGAVLKRAKDMSS